MTINKKLVTLLVCAVVMTVGAISATMAYFTDSDAAVNTFTVGHVDITLDEAKVDELGDKILDENGQPVARVTENKYKLIPGSTYLKDPTVHVSADSDECWLFVTVNNQIEAIEGGKTIAAQMAEKGWTLVAGERNVYAYKEIVGANADVPVFEKFTIKGDGVNNDSIAAAQDKEINVIAYAVQAVGFNTAQDAWDATFGK